jgi:hypothetical protein
MNGKTLRMIALGLGGLVVALALVVGAFALAGQQIAQPAGVPIFTTSTTPSPTPGDDRTASPSPERQRTDSPSPSVDDHGGGTGESTLGGSSGSDDGAAREVTTPRAQARTTRGAVRATHRAPDRARASTVTTDPGSLTHP